MAPRRSSRLRDAPDQKLSDAAQEASDQTENGKKRKTSTGRETTKNAGVSKRAKKSATKAVETSTAGKVEGRDVQNLNNLSFLSPEIFTMVVDNITDKSTISALMRTSKKLFTLMAPRLYNRIAVAAMFHAHIAKVIRTLEPHLTIKQKKQLKKEGKYRGQQERYPTGLDEKKVPMCAGYVQQLIIGASDPGKKHRYIVERYYEEALRNMENLAIVETRVVNKSICEGIASLASLKALSIYAYDAESDDVAPLVHIRNLKHLKLGIGSENTVTGQRLMHNSMSTLQSLEMNLGSCWSHYFNDWEKSLKSSGHDTASRSDKRPDFPALRSLRIEGARIDVEFIKEFPKAVELSRLRELTLVYVGDPETLLWPLLTDMMFSYKRSNTPLNLRTLHIDMSESWSHYEPGMQTGLFEAKCRFIASFDTLTTLKLPGHGEYESNQGLENPGLSDTLLQAILKHKNLRILRISYSGKSSRFEIPYVGAQSIGEIVDGLPQLREFEFAPDEPQMDEISQALCRGKNLECVTCYPHESWCNYPPPPYPLGTNILSSILSTFISDVPADADGKAFVWEDHYKLSRIDLSHTTWDIASKFGKRKKKGHEKAEKFQVDVEGGTREVWHQRVPDIQYVHVGYDPLFEWVAKVEKQLE